MNGMIWLWLGAAVVFGVVEAATAGLVSIWFVAGALGALIGAWLGASVAVQMVVFAVVSAAALALTRPLVARMERGSPVATNLDRVLGETARVTETVDNGLSTGTVYVDGKTWTARSADGNVIPAGSMVRVENMEGVKLFVQEIKQTDEKTEVAL